MQLQRLTREIPMDTLTPLAVWLRLHQAGQLGFLFESEALI